MRSITVSVTPPDNKGVYHLTATNIEDDAGYFFQDIPGDGRMTKLTPVEVPDDVREELKSRFLDIFDYMNKLVHQLKLMN